MKQHTADFKAELINLGRQIDSIITYDNTTLHDELYAVTPHFEGNILKSVMKQLDIESSVDIPLETVVNYQLGLLIDGDYEYLNYGNYVVYSSEKQEDTKTYKIVCYDKMLYTMKQNEDLGVTYPITIKNYLTALGNKVGLQVKDTTFANQSQEIPSELYTDLEYTYRDILDEIAQATGSIIVINEDDEIEVKYPTNTSDTIDEEYLKDVNVNFGEKYGPINSVVLSRAGESDNVYIQDAESIAEYGLTEIKIVDNQIMNFNNRSDYLAGILNKLNGFYYYLNNFDSIGILYYDFGDLYGIDIDGNTYQCCMLNDEINVTSGIKEIVYTEMPEQSETDYSKADKTDRRINQTYIIVDKQNQTIESVVSNVTTQNQKISRIEQTVDELNSKISDVADITTSQESTNGFVEFEDINESEPIRIEIHPRGENISFLYPREGLYPSNTLYPASRTIRFTNTSTSEVFDYELPTDLLYYDSTHYDEFILDYDSQTCIVNKKVGYNADGTTYVLSTPTTETFTPYPYIYLSDGDYRVEMLGYNSAYIFVRLMVQNIYTTQFATKAEMNSAISQTATEINLTVSQKVGKNEIISSINQSAESISINASKINLNGAVTANNYFKINLDGSIEAISGTIGGFTISNNKLYNSKPTLTASSSGVYIGTDGISLGSGSTFKVTSAGALTATNANISGNITATTGTFDYCTIKNTCSVPASTVSGTLATSTIPNLSAAKLTSGIISGDRLSGVNASFGDISASSFGAISISADAISLNNVAEAYGIGNYTGKTFDLIVQHEGQYWRRLRFKGGILVQVDENW